MTDEAPSVGEALSRAREARGLALADVAQQLKFNPRHLEALEANRFQALPGGGTFARGMVRGYARLLKLDPEPLLEQLSGRFEAPDSADLAQRFSEPVPFSDSGRRSTLVYLAVSVVVLGFVGLVAYEWHRERNAPPPLAAQTPQPARPVAVPVQPAAAPVAEAQAAAAPASQPIAKQAKSQPKETKVAAAKPADEPKSIGGGGRIVLRCEEESWIEVKDAADRTLISSLNSAGSERVVEGKAPFTLVIGNAQHVRVSYNNKPVDLAPHTKVEVARFILE